MAWTWISEQFRQRANVADLNRWPHMMVRNHGVTGQRPLPLLPSASIGSRPPVRSQYRNLWGTRDVPSIHAAVLDLSKVLLAGPNLSSDTRPGRRGKVRLKQADRMACWPELDPSVLYSTQEKGTEPNREKAAGGF